MARGLLTPAAATTTVPARPRQLNSRTAWTAALLLLLIWSLAQLGIGDRRLVNPGGITQVAQFVAAAFQPDLSAQFLRLTFEATLVTVGYAVLGTFLSLILGFAGSLLVSETMWKAWMPTRRRPTLYRAPWAMSRGLLAIPRGIHEVIWGLFFVIILGLDPLAAILAIAIPFGAIVAKVFAEAIDDAPHEPFDALITSGASPFKALLYGLLPQALPDMISYAFYRLECSIRASVVLGMIGAGGLGYEILLSFQTLNYNEMWTLFYALFALCALTDLWSSVLRQRMGRMVTCTTSDATPIEGLAELPRRGQAGAPQGDRFISGSLIAAGALTVLSFWYIDPTISKLWAPKTLTLLAGLIDDVFPLSLTLPQLTVLLKLSGQTLAMSVLATGFAAVGGLFLAFPAARNFAMPGALTGAGSHGRARRWLGAAVLVFTRGLLLVQRAIPSPVWALMLLFVFFPGVLPGALALGIYNLGVLGRLMAESVENMDERPVRSLQALGTGRMRAFLYGVLPLTAPRFTAYTLYRWEIVIRETVVVGLVGAGGLGRLLAEQLSSFDYSGVAVTLLFYIALTFMVDLASASIRKAYR